MPHAHSLADNDNRPGTDHAMRRPRDLDAELKTLHDKRRQLVARRTTQLGQLVHATGADALPLDTLTGALLDAVAKLHAGDPAIEAWRLRGEAFFRGRKRPARTNGTRPTAPAVANDHQGAAAGDGGPASR